MDGLGAIVNNNTTSTPSGDTTDLQNVTISGDTTIGGLALAATTTGGVGLGLPTSLMGRMEFNGNTPSLAGNAYNLTKTGNNLLLMADTTCDSTTTNFVINSGILGLQSNYHYGRPAGTITVNGSGAGQAPGGSFADG